MNEEKRQPDTDINSEIIDLVVARLKTIPPTVSIQIGNKGSFDIEELIKRVKSKDEVGKKIVEMQLLYLRSLKNLPIENNVSSDN